MIEMLFSCIVNNSTATEKFQILNNLANIAAKKLKNSLPEMSVS